jgi:hypothetical protein
MEDVSLKDNVAARIVWISIAAVGIFASPNLTAVGHHSFAMYDQSQVVTLTGRLTRFVHAPNHAQLIFELIDNEGAPVLDDDGEPVAWGVETGPSTRIARLGVTPDNFPIGTIITVQLNPLRDGRTFGALPNGRPLVNCGMAMPTGGCTAETGTVYLTENY